MFYRQHQISTLPDKIIIPEKFRISLKGQRFLLFDSGIGDVGSLMIFGTTQMLSLLRDSYSCFADGIFKVVPSQFFHLYTLHFEKDEHHTMYICTNDKYKRNNVRETL